MSKHSKQQLKALGFTVLAMTILAIIHNPLLAGLGCIACGVMIVGFLGGN